MPDSTSNNESTTNDNASDLFVAQLMEHRHRIYAFIAKQLVNPADAEDVFQKTSIVSLEKDAGFRHRGEFLSLGVRRRFQRGAELFDRAAPQPASL